jgi:hypothetical protein
MSAEVGVAAEVEAEVVVALAAGSGRREAE